MNLGDVRSSKFLRKEDIGVGVLATISRLTKENIAIEGADSDYKVTVHFAELDKPLVLNSTNGQIIAGIVGTEEDIEISWVGTKIVLYTDPNVSFQGRLVGGIRVRAPKPGSVAAIGACTRARPTLLI
jgi:hypothetical protein